MEGELDVDLAIVPSIRVDESFINHILNLNRSDRKKQRSPFKTRWVKKRLGITWVKKRKDREVW